MTDISEHKLKENFDLHLNTGAIANVDAERDWFKRKSPFDSWFIVGHAEDDGEPVDFLCHILAMDFGEKGVVNFNASIINENTGVSDASDKVVPFNQVSFTETGEGIDKVLKITMPDGDGMEGNIYHSQWKVDLPESKIDVDLVTYGMVLYDAGTGTFPTCFNRPFNQYSVPDMRANGTINLKGKEYRLKDCKVWFDRQWDVEGAKTGNATSSTELFSGLKWTWSWMDINLDNGEDMSLWDMHNITNKYHYTWATVLHKDGSQTTVPIENLTVGASDFWRSEKSGQNYPTKFVVRIPDYDAELTVTSVKKEQEIASDIKFLNKYEGASTVEGTYKGKKVKGYTYVEMLGNWE